MIPFCLMPEDQWNEVLERFSQQVRMTTCLTDELGSNPRCRGDRHPLCAAIRANSEALTFICSQTNTVMLAQVKTTLMPAIDLCEAGLVRLVVPIVRGGKLVGQVTACGCASMDEELDPFLVARQLGLSEERVLDLAGATPTTSELELQPVVDRLFHDLNPTSTSGSRP